MKIIDKNTDLKNFRVQKDSEKLEVFTWCFIAIVVMMCLAALKQSWDEGIERSEYLITTQLSCDHDHEYH
jgi:hypothetical protein